MIPTSTNCILYSIILLQKYIIIVNPRIIQGVCLTKEDKGLTNKINQTTFIFIITPIFEKTHRFLLILVENVNSKHLIIINIIVFLLFR